MYTKAVDLLVVLTFLWTIGSKGVSCSALAAPGRDLSTSYYYPGQKRPSRSSEEYVDDYYYDDSNSGERGGRSRNMNDPSSVGAAIWEFLGETLRKGNRGGTTNVNYAPKFGPTFNKIVINKEAGEAADVKTAGGDNPDNPDNLDHIDGVEVQPQVKTPAKKAG